MAFHKRTPAAEAPKFEPNKLNDEVAKTYAYTGGHRGRKNQLYLHPRTGIRFSLENVTVTQVERMVRVGSKDFTLKTKEEKADEKAKR